MEEPRAKQVPFSIERHGDIRQDPYYWLREKSNPAVIAYLEAENAYHEHNMAPLQPMVDWLYEQMVNRVPEADQNVPVKGNAYYYYIRNEKALQYPVYARKKTTDRSALDTTDEQPVLDLNTLVEDGGYLSVTEQRVSPDESRLAYLVNRDGSDRYTLKIKDIDTNQTLADEIQDVFIGGSLEWDATGEYVFYVMVDDSQRPYRLWRHQVGAAEADTLIYEETDETFELCITKSNSGRFLFAESRNKVSSEIRVLDATLPLDRFEVIKPRRHGIEYSLEHWGNDFLMLTNEGAKNFRLLRTTVADALARAMTLTASDATHTTTDTASWVDLFPYDERRYLQSVHPFRDGLLIEGREKGLTEVWTYKRGTLTKLAWDEPVYSVSLAENRSYDTTEILIRYESLLTPRTTYALDLVNGSITSLQVAPVQGPYDASQYRQERLWATAVDGTQVPMFAVYRVDALANGPAPTLLYGYGSYGASCDPRFDPLRLPLLDLGLVMVTAQVRGGSEMGYGWYEDGKWLHKRNTFTDFIAAAEDLIRRGYTGTNKLAAQGRSAGGLLMGAVVNLAPHVFQVVHAGVPFVDVVTTMLDPTIPLTTLEYDEWGNPEDKTYYKYMKSYSPYDNVTGQPYPHLLVTTGLNDPRVAYWEPAKWVAKLRELKTDDHQLLLKTHMGSGHFGSSGRFDHIKELAADYVFLLDKIGVRVGQAGDE